VWRALSWQREGRKKEERRKKKEEGRMEKVEMTKTWERRSVERGERGLMETRVNGLLPKEGERQGE
jgi:hypothetical protein